MQIFTKIINVKDPKKPVFVDLISDVHLGARGCAVDKFVKAIEDGRKIGSYVVGLGDYFDAITPADRRYDRMDISKDEFEYNGLTWDLGSLEGQFMFFEKVLEPVAKDGRLLGLGIGNHGGRVFKQTTANQVRMICSRFNTQYMGYMSHWKIVFKHKGKKINEVKFFTYHGSGGGTTPGASIQIHERLRRSFDASVYAFGHSHQLISFERVRLISDGKNSIAQLVHHGVTGSFLRSYRAGEEGYAEWKAYDPLVVGFLRVKIIPATKHIELKCINMDQEE